VKERFQDRLRARALSGNNPEQVAHTHVPLFTKQYNLVPVKGRRRSAAGKVTVGLASKWPCVTWTQVVYQPTDSTTNAYAPDGAQPGLPCLCCYSEPGTLMYRMITVANWPQLLEHASTAWISIGSGTSARHFLLLVHGLPNSHPICETDATVMRIPNNHTVYCTSSSSSFIW